MIPDSLKKALIAMAGRHFGSGGEGFIGLALVKPMDVLIESMDRMESYVNE